MKAHFTPFGAGITDNHDPDHRTLIGVAVGSNGSIALEIEEQQPGRPRQYIDALLSQEGACGLRDLLSKALPAATFHATGAPRSGPPPLCVLRVGDASLEIDDHGVCGVTMTLRDPGECTAITALMTVAEARGLGFALLGAAEGAADRQGRPGMRSIADVLDTVFRDLRVRSRQDPHPTRVPGGAAP